MSKTTVDVHPSVALHRIADRCKQLYIFGIRCVGLCGIVQNIHFLGNKPFQLVFGLADEHLSDVLIFRCHFNAGNHFYRIILVFYDDGLMHFLTSS